MRFINHIPLLRLSPFNLPDNDRLHMAIRAYYDGSGKSHDPYYSLIALAGFSASEKVWPRVESEWKAVLAQYDVPYAHMKEVIHGKGPFKGWDKKKRVQFVLDLISALEKFTEQEELWGYSCCVSKDGFERAREEIQYLRDRKIKIVDICADHCVGRLTFAQENYDSPRPITLYFDVGDPFICRIRRVYESEGGERAMERKKGWPYQVSAIVPVNMRQVYPVQAADLLAWIIRRHYTHSDYKELHDALFVLNRYDYFFDYEKIKEEYSNRGGEAVSN